MLRADYFLHDDVGPKQKKKNKKQVKCFKKSTTKKKNRHLLDGGRSYSVSPFKCYNAAVNDSIIPDNNGHQSHSTHVAPDPPIYSPCAFVTVREFLV